MVRHVEDVVQTALELAHVVSVLGRAARAGYAVVVLEGHAVDLLARRCGEKMRTNGRSSDWVVGSWLTGILVSPQKSERIYKITLKMWNGGNYQENGVSL